MMFRIMTLAVFVGLSSAHMCLITPSQRGGFGNITHVGELKCRKLSMCDESGEVTPMNIFHRGQVMEIVIQKNQDHYNASDVGHFTTTFVQVDTIILTMF